MSHTFKDVGLQLQALGMTIVKMNAEYKVNVKGGQEATAYYTTDLDDAFATGKYMAKAFAACTEREIFNADRFTIAAAIAYGVKPSEVSTSQRLWTLDFVHQKFAAQQGYSHVYHDIQ